MLQIITDSISEIIGSNPERKSSRNTEEGANNFSSLSFTNQSNETNGVDGEPTLSAG